MTHRTPRYSAHVPWHGRVTSAVPLQPVHRPLAITGRQRQVWEMVALGYWDKEIGARLGLAYDTVRHHQKALRQRLGVSSRAELGRVWGEQEGHMLLTIDDVETIISRTVTACIRIDVNASTPSLDPATMQQGVIRQAAQDIVNGVRPTWDSEHEGKANT